LKSLGLSLRNPVRRGESCPAVPAETRLLGIILVAFGAFDGQNSLSTSVQKHINTNRDCQFNPEEKSHTPAGLFRV
jgi:hypothetical protein